MKTPKFWYKQYKTWQAILLYPLSLLYAKIAKCITFNDKSYRPQMPVICVGNIVAGGAGKTTVVDVLATFLRDRGVRVAIVSKGYKGQFRRDSHKAAGVLLDVAVHDVSFAGDEPWMLAQKHQVYITDNRVASIKFLEQLGVHDVILLDDGLQDFSCYKQVSLCVMKEGYGFGNGLALPAGPLRRLLPDALPVIDAFVMMRSYQHGVDHVPTSLYHKDVLTVFVDKLVWHAGGLLGDAPSLRAENVPADHLKIILFSGIAHPADFFASVTDYFKVEVVGALSYPDHYAFTSQDENDLREKAKKTGAVLVTTHKDYVRLSLDFQKEVVFIKQEGMLHNPETWCAFLLGKGIPVA